MIIKSVRVQNFRCIEDETLPCEDLTVLVGRNGSGKSSFLRAIDTFYNANARYTEDDFYAGDKSRDIIITVTFGELTDEEANLFKKYVENGELTVQKVMIWPPGRGNQKYYGMSLQNPDFAAFRSARGQDKRSEYNKLREQNKYAILPQYTNQDEAEKALSKWEADNPTLCVRQQDDGQFFGFKEVGQAQLERHTRFLFVPAVREAADDATEGRGSVFTELMDLVVRSVLSQRPEIEQLQEETQRKYKELFDPSKITELQSLGHQLTDTLRTFVPDASVELTWMPGEGVNIQMPTANINLVEDEHSGPVSHSGHGLQRAFILTMLQHLARAQASGLGANSGLSDRAPQAATPNLIIAIEEPELYQHPSRQRHMARILLKLAEGSIKGVAERTQVIYSTHSPLLVDLARFEKIRVLRKETSEEGKPRRTKVFFTTLDEVARVIAKAGGKPEGTYTRGTLEPRLRAIMTPWMNEGFFADVVVLVEGEEDRAAVIGVANAKGIDLEGRGIAIIPCNGKHSIDRPVVIFRELGIPAYAIWDSDKDESGSKPEDNHRLLRLFGEPIQDWPHMVTDEFACFGDKLSTTLREEIGAELYERELDSACDELGLMGRKDAAKNPMVVERIIRAAYAQGKPPKTLESIISKIMAIPK